MHGLHAATGPKRATGAELLNCICSASTQRPMPFLVSQRGTGICLGDAIRGFRPGDNMSGMWCIQKHILGARLNLVFENLTYGGGMTVLISTANSTDLIGRRGATAREVMAILSPLSARMGGLN
jgi:hypothetical protein